MRRTIYFFLLPFLLLISLLVFQKNAEAKLTQDEATTSPKLTQEEILSLLASEEKYTPPDWVKGAVIWWYICLIIAFILLVIAIIIRSSALLGVGSFLLGISVIIVAGTYLYAYFLEETEKVTYAKCKAMFIPDVSIFSAPGVVYTFSCILAGYVPTELDLLTAVTHVIFGMILPLAFLFIIFASLIPEALIPSINARRALGAIMSLLTFRVFLSTLLIHFLTYGIGGIGAIALGTLLGGMIYKAAYGLVAPALQTKKELAFLLEARRKEILEEIDKCLKVLESPTASEELKKKAEKTIEELQEVLKRLGKWRF
jgi:hypothetical protein